MKQLLLLFIFALALSSCKHDPCDGVPCGNGGTCTNNSCACPTGFGGPKCYSVCPPGYSGANCDEARTPTKITITEMNVMQFPSTNAGVSWDAGGNDPDLKIVVNKGTSGIYQSEVKTDCAPLWVYTFTPSAAIAITDLSAAYYFILYDDDGGTSQVMGTTDIYFPNSINSFPSTIHLVSGDNATQIDLTVSYTW